MRRILIFAALLALAASFAGATDAMAKRRHRVPASHGAAPSASQEARPGQMSHPGGGSNSK